MEWPLEHLTGFGRCGTATSYVQSASTVTDIQRLVLESPSRSLIARGAGLSYGDPAQCRDGRVIRTLALAGIEAFDTERGEVVLGAGVTFGALLRVLAPTGWLPPVTPGTQFATMGGALANDVHGKNHDADGSFGNHVAWFDLVLPSGELRRVSRDSDSDLFTATVGGIGLTGIVTRLCLRLRRGLGTHVRVEERRMRDLDEFVATLEQVRTRYRYTVGWIDGLSTGRHFGRGILELGAESGPVAELPRRRRVRLPFDLPSGTINSHTVGLFNALYFRRVPAGGRQREAGMETFLYPLDALIDWNRMYGRAGFRQFQCVVPGAAAPRGLRKLLERVHRSGNASFLAVIKTLGSNAIGCLSFPTPGYTLALDIPNRLGSHALFEDLHDITLDHGGRVYLAKDACLDAARFAHMYPRLNEMRIVLDRIDPGRRMRSDMSTRLAI